MEVRVDPATLDDCLDLAPNMRQADKDEIWASAKLGPYGALVESWELSPMSWAGKVDDEVVCIFGVGAVSFLSQKGAPWLLGAHGLERYSFAFLRRNQSIIREMHELFPLLENYVDARNETSIRWLRWLGFKIEEPVPYGAFGMPFHRFWKEAS